MIDVIPVHTPARRLGLLAAGLVAVLLAVSACTGSPAPAPTTPATTGGHTGSAPTSPAPTGSPKGSAGTGVSKPWIVGLMDRQGPPAVNLLSLGGKPLIEGFVISVYWKDVQPQGPGDFVTSAIDQQVAFAEQHNLAVRFRVYAGYNSPPWVLQQAGSVPWTNAGGGGPASYDVPVFWGATFQQLYQAFDAKLAAKYDPVPQVREVDAGMCITNFAEPFIRQFSIASNTVTAKTKGYTESANEQCLRRTVDVVKADWKTTNMAMAFNPYQGADTQGSTDKNAANVSQSVVLPKAIATYCLQQLASRCVLGNDSMQGGSRGPSYDALYAMLASLQAPVYIQTATAAKIKDWQAALSSSVQVGAVSIELPVGYRQWDLTALQGFDGQLQANANKLRG